MRNAKLTVADIEDLRTYERSRAAFLDHVIALKKRRRVGVGPFVTLLFENVDTVRAQVQEMARAERMLTDAQIQAELDIYNPLIPQPANLAATLFVELTTEAELRAWLPKLVGIERSVALSVGPETVWASVDPAHAAQLTREEVTASVHYVHFSFTPAQVEAFRSAPVTLAVRHPAYEHATPLTEDTRESLLEDLLGD
ncbi:MAG: DUF3501 family protein [Actinobacteria bacterium]|nr:DUF3501 family protein [Actinomycetota bacterium]